MVQLKADHLQGNPQLGILTCDHIMQTKPIKAAYAAAASIHKCNYSILSCTRPGSSLEMTFNVHPDVSLHIGLYRLSLHSRLCIQGTFALLLKGAQAQNLQSAASSGIAACAYRAAQ